MIPLDRRVMKVIGKSSEQPERSTSEILFDKIKRLVTAAVDQISGAFGDTVSAMELRAEKQRKADAEKMDKALGAIADAIDSIETTEPDMIPKTVSVSFERDANGLIKSPVKFIVSKK